jgi:hypothetical protein
MATPREVDIASKKSRKWATQGPSWGIYESLKQTLTNYREELLQPIAEILDSDKDPAVRLNDIRMYLLKVRD